MATLRLVKAHGFVSDSVFSVQLFFFLLSFSVLSYAYLFSFVAEIWRQE